jgi:hypothetical protein
MASLDFYLKVSAPALVVVRVGLSLFLLLVRANHIIHVVPVLEKP